MDFARYQELLELGWQIGGSVRDVQIADAKHEYHALRASARDGSGLCNLTVLFQHPHFSPQKPIVCLLDSLHTVMHCSECLTVSTMASTTTLGARYVVRLCVAFVLYHSCLRYELKRCILR